MKRFILALMFCLPLPALAAETAKFVETPYTKQKVVFDFYFDHPEKINSALYWVRSWMKPLIEGEQGYSIEDMDVVIIIHGTEIVTVAKKNYKKYKSAVERMRYYNSLGVKIKVCALAMKDFDYDIKDFHGFIEVVPSAMTEIAHWQLKGYALIRPIVYEKKFSIDEIR